MKIFTEMWFYVALLGIIYAGFLGWTARFTAKDPRGKHGVALWRRNNAGRRERLEVITSGIVYAVIWAEIFYRAKYGMPEPLTLKIFSENIFYEMFLYSVFYFTGYTMLLFGVDTLMDIIHIGVFQRLEEAKTAKRLEAYLEEQEEQRRQERLLARGVQRIMRQHNW